MKFRVWDKITKRMYYKVKIDWNGIWFYRGDEERSERNYEGYSPWGSKYTKLMVSWGLKDKHNKDIYEADIIKITTGEDEYEYYVVMDGKCPILGLLGSENIEVIGNIYENPELLPLLTVKLNNDCHD